MLRQFSEDELLGKPLSEQQKRDLLALVEKPEEVIDTSDIPEVRQLPPHAFRGNLFGGRTV